MKSPNVLKREDGFTLIEIIAVLILLGILAAVAIPKYMDLQEQARIKAAESAIAETQSRLSMAYGQFLLVNNGAQPADIAAVCNGVATTVLPANAAGDVPMGADFTVTLADTGVITVSVVDTVTLTTPVTGSWTLPTP